MRLAVLGDPVAHSLSPRLHAAALAAADIEGQYEARQVDSDGMAAAAAEMRSGQLDGANITMPHKRLAAELTDDLDPTAAAIGAANTWSVEGSRLIGHSTDPAGVRFAIEWCGLPSAGPVLVLGAGGAAAAAVLATADRPVFVAARRPEAADQLIAASGSSAQPVRWGEPIADALVINATPVGMQGEALPAGIVERANGLLDMVYGEMMAPAVVTATERGIPACDGVPMLVGQARESFRIWTGVEVAPEVMFAALNPSSSRPAGPKNQL